MSAAEQLARGVDALGLQLPPEAQRRLLDFAALLVKWNRTYNLTAIRDEESIVSHHLLDSLAVIPHLDGRNQADIGSGGGLPGIPLAIAHPERCTALVESNGKKAAFLRQAQIELSLANVAVHCERVEAWEAPHPLDIVISRAFSDLAEFVRLSGHLVAPEGVLAAMKGVYPYEEIAQLPPGFRIDRVIPLAVPGVEAARHLVLIRRN